MTASVIYVAQSDDGLIKIGCTRRPVGLRLRALSRQRGQGVRLLRTMRGGFKEEAALCRKFRDAVVIGREWFSPNEEILRFARSGSASADGEARDVCHVTVGIAACIFDALNAEREAEAERYFGMRPTLTRMVLTLLNEALAARAKLRERRK